MRLSEFLKAGHLLQDGDKYSLLGTVYEVGEDYPAEKMNLPGFADSWFIVISAKCLEEPSKMKLTKPGYFPTDGLNKYEIQAVLDMFIMFGAINHEGTEISRDAPIRVNACEFVYFGIREDKKTFFTNHPSKFGFNAERHSLKDARIVARSRCAVKDIMYKLGVTEL